MSILEYKTTTQPICMAETATPHITSCNMGGFFQHRKNKTTVQAEVKGFLPAFIGKTKKPYL